MTTTRRLGFLVVMAVLGSACSSKDALLQKRDGAIDQPGGGTGGTLPGAGGTSGSLGGTGGNSATGGSTSGAGGIVAGTGGSGTGGILVGTGGIGSGGIATGAGGRGIGGILPGTGGTGTGGIVAGTGGTVVGTGGSGRGGTGSGGAVSTGGNSGGVIGTGGVGGQGGTGQGGSAPGDAGPDAPSDAMQPDCPSSVSSGSCSVSSTTICYYGDDTRWFCKTSAKCSQGTWQVTQPMTECTATPDPGCPADPASPPASICSADGGTKATCVYSTQFCKCGFNGGPNPAWVCSRNLPAECPALPPGDGSQCTMTSGVWCTYGLSCSGHDMQCVEGKWVTVLLAC